MDGRSDNAWARVTGSARCLQVWVNALTEDAAKLEDMDDVITDSTVASVHPHSIRSPEPILYSIYLLLSPRREPK